MADNYNIKDAAGTTIALKAKEVSPGVFSNRYIPQVGDADVSSGNPLPVTNSSLNTLAGAVTETAPVTDTASSGLNGRLQRIAQRLTSLIALIPSSLGQKVSAASLAVVVASDQSNVPAKVLLTAGVARQLTTAAASANTALTAGIKAVSIYARNSDARISIGNTSQTASSSSHFIASGERIDLDVSGFATPNIGIIYGPSAAAAILEISELS